MKKMMLLMVALLPLTLQAKELNDTLINAGKRQIEIRDSAGTVNISVYNKESGKNLEKIYDASFADGREESRIYVTSPFFPNILTKKKSVPHLHANYPFFFMGFNTLSDKAVGLGGSAALHTRDARSWEWGLNLGSIAVPIGPGYGFTSAFSFSQVHHHFQGNYVMATSDEGVTTMQELDGKNLRKSYISYNLVRVPIMFEWQTVSKRSNHFYAGIGMSLELRWNEHSRYFEEKRKITQTSDINLNPFGMNLEAKVGYGIIQLYARTAFTPLLKRSSAPSCFPMAIGIGLML